MLRSLVDALVLFELVIDAPPPLMMSAGSDLHAYTSTTRTVTIHILSHAVSTTTMYPPTFRS